MTHMPANRAATGILGFEYKSPIQLKNVILNKILNALPWLCVKELFYNYNFICILQYFIFIECPLVQGAMIEMYDIV